MPMVMTEFSGNEAEVINMITETCSVCLVIYHLQMQSYKMTSDTKKILLSM